MDRFVAPLMTIVSVLALTFLVVENSEGAGNRVVSRMVVDAELDTESKASRHEHHFRDAGRKVQLRATSRVRSGELKLRLYDPKGVLAWDYHGETGSFEQFVENFPSIEGTWVLEVEPTDATGSYLVKLESRRRSGDKKSK